MSALERNATKLKATVRDAQKVVKIEIRTNSLGARQQKATKEQLNKTPKKGLQFTKAKNEKEDIIDPTHKNGNASSS